MCACALVFNSIQLIATAVARMLATMLAQQQRIAAHSRDLLCVPHVFCPRSGCECARQRQAAAAVRARMLRMLLLQQSVYVTLYRLRIYFQAGNSFSPHVWGHACTQASTRIRSAHIQWGIRRLLCVRACSTKLHFMHFSHVRALASTEQCCSSSSSSRPGVHLHGTSCQLTSSELKSILATVPPCACLIAFNFATKLRSFAYETSDWCTIHNNGHLTRPKCLLLDARACIRAYLLRCHIQCACFARVPVCCLHACLPFDAAHKS